MIQVSVKGAVLVSVMLIFQRPRFRDFPDRPISCDLVAIKEKRTAPQDCPFPLHHCKYVVCSELHQAVFDGIPDQFGPLSHRQLF